jgi:hypothetical protein
MTLLQVSMSVSENDSTLKTTVNRILSVTNSSCLAQY